MQRLRTLFVITFSLLLGNARLHAQTGIFKNHDIYLYNNQKDTLVLDSVTGNGLCLCDSVKLTGIIQMNEPDLKIAVFYRNCYCSNEDHGGTFDVSEHKATSQYEVWSLDTKTLLFKAVNSLVSDFNNFNVYDTPNRQRGRNAYKYDFLIDGKGLITIRNLSDDDNSKPDHEEGTYKLVDGKYTKQ